MDYNQAVKRVKELKRFYKSLLWFGIVAAIVYFDDIFEKGRIDFSLYDGSIIFLIWGIILTVKAVKLFVFDSEWENEIIEREVKKSKEPINFNS
ncbi:2TM domain-containing protein [Chryseobacterium sp. JUb7]|uniref:2TM domain-containing protein n=1 Tax=Chryseobacterium sp. JUb7 TaxID=2940599 RepID=UPI00216879AE|nr:2TM domain-containing protein [Chryseobacterium sp. JUb7]MCS3530191.1 hypothetical protein [Chryseobacterium sp. JUb7]